MTILGEFDHHAHITDEETEVQSSYMSNVTQLVSSRASTQTQAWLTPESVFFVASQPMTTCIVILEKWTRDKTKGPEGSGRLHGNLGWTTCGEEEQTESIWLLLWTCLRMQRRKSNWNWNARAKLSSPCYSVCGPQVRNTSIPGELVRNARSQAHPRRAKSGSAFSKFSRWCACT